MIHKCPCKCLYDDTRGIWIRVDTDCGFIHRELDGKTGKVWERNRIEREEGIEWCTMGDLTRAVKLEREACAEIAIKRARHLGGLASPEARNVTLLIADMIRSRGDE